jgi:hypothetical protein
MKKRQSQQKPRLPSTTPPLSVITAGSFLRDFSGCRELEFFVPGFHLPTCHRQRIAVKVFESVVVTHCPVGRSTFQGVLGTQVICQFFCFHPDEVSDVLQIRGVLWPCIAFCFSFHPLCRMIRVKLVVAQYTVDECAAIQCEPIDRVFAVFIIRNYQQLRFFCVSSGCVSQNPIATVVYWILVSQLCNTFPCWLVYCLHS